MAHRVVPVHRFDVLPRRAAHRPPPALRDVGRPLRGEVAHAGVVHDARETVGLRRDPRREVAAVRSSGRGHARRIREPSRDEQVRGGHHVLVGLISPASEDRRREFLSPSRRAVEVHDRDAVAGRREGLHVPAPVPLIARGRVRPAVDDLDERERTPGSHAPGRVGEEHLHLPAPRALEVDLLDGPELERVHHGAREAREPLQVRAVGRARVDLRRLLQRFARGEQARQQHPPHRRCDPVQGPQPHPAHAGRLELPPARAR